MMMLTIVLGLTINELTLHYKSTILAAWIHGVFKSQAYGIWRVMYFANANPFLGGIPGLVGIAVPHRDCYHAVGQVDRDQLAVQPRTRLGHDQVTVIRASKNLPSH